MVLVVLLLMGHFTRHAQAAASGLAHQVAKIEVAVSGMGAVAVAAVGTRGNWKQCTA
jgi:hypothetical protein